jgi:uncharacterized protein YndB with AHSA1/START domain
MSETKEYDWSQFKLKVDIKSPIEKVFQAWTDDAIVTKWFSVKANIEPVKGGRVAFEWLGGDKLDDKIIDVRKAKLFHFPFGPKGEQVLVTFTKIKEGTRLELHQFNMKTTPADRITMHMGCKTGWVFFLSNCKAFLEAGHDLRSHDPHRSYKQGFLNS